MKNRRDKNPNGQTIDPVVENGLCTGCGTCVGLCPQSAIKMVKNKRQGIYIPQLYKEKCNQCGICLKACAGQSLDFNQLNRQIFGKLPEDNLAGNFLNCYTGYATNETVRYNSASGGLVTALLISAREQGIINGALVTRMSKDRPLEPEPYIAATNDEIIAAAKSKYCPVPANIAIRQILEKDGKYAVVGLPCHIQGIRKAEATNQTLSDRIVLHIGIFCSHTNTFPMTDFILRRYKINKKDILSLNYRGEGWPGAMTIQMKNGTKRIIPLDDYSNYHQMGLFSPSRCGLCCDQFAELADVSMGDAWLPEITSRDKIGTSVVVTRTPRGEEICALAAKKGDIVLAPTDIKRIRQWSAGKKKRAQLRVRWLKLSGKKTPIFNGGLVNPGIPDYLTGTLFFFNRWLSAPSYLRWGVAPAVSIEQKAKRLLIRLRRH